MANTTSRARRLREELTEAERLLWRNLRGHQMLGYPFLRQEPLGRYIVDLVCYQQRLIIELDGGQYSEQVDYDRERTRWLESRAFKVVRFWNDDVSQETDGVLESIRLAL